MAEILFVDDEKHILSALKRVFHEFNGHVCHFADSPKVAIEILTSHRISVIVSDHKMPQMTGAEFLSRVKEKRPDVVTIMLTGQADFEAVQKAVNSGEIYRFILKPWKDQDLRGCVESALAFHARVISERNLQEVTQNQNEQLTSATAQLEDQVATRTQQLSDALHTARAMNSVLEDTLYSSTLALFQVIQLARPDLGAHLRRVADVAVALARAVGLPENTARETEIAALLHDCGKLSMPSYIVNKNPADYSREEDHLYRTHPMVSTEPLRSISYFANVCAFIHAHHERFDGSGFPNRESGSSIPTSAYLLGLADEYDHLTSGLNSNQELKHQIACERLAQKSDKEFPAPLVHACLDFAKTERNRQASEDQMTLGVAGLIPHLVLRKDVYTISGSLLMARGAILTGQSITRIRAIAKMDPIMGDIHVVRIRERSASRA
jgi:response regulator RpfG family c-di-GMP phosphodiesterase